MSATYRDLRRLMRQLDLYRSRRIVGATVAELALIATPPAPDCVVERDGAGMVKAWHHHLEAILNDDLLRYRLPGFAMTNAQLTEAVVPPAPYAVVLRHGAGARADARR